MEINSNLFSRLTFLLLIFLFAVVNPMYSVFFVVCCGRLLLFGQDNGSGMIKVLRAGE